MHVKKLSAVEISFITLLVLSSSGMVGLSFIVCATVVIMFLVRKDLKLNKALVRLCMPLVFLLLVGSIFAYKNTAYDVEKDIWYILKIVLWISVGFMSMTYIKSFKALCRLIIIAGALLAIYHLVRVVIHINVLNISELYHLREDLGISGSLLSILSLVLLVVKRRLFVFPFSLYVILVMLMSLSVLLSVSRVYLVISFVLFLLLKGKDVFSMKGVLVLSSVFAIVFIAVITNPDSQLITKFENSINEIAVSDYTNKSDINANWRGFEAYRALVTFMSGNAAEKVFGQGLGALIDIGFTMKLGGNDMRFIPMTHNGYMAILVKYGLLGIFIYFYFIYKLLYYKVPQKQNSEEVKVAKKLIASVGIIIFLTTFVISGLFNIYQLDGTLTILGALVYYVSSNQENFFGGRSSR